MAVRDDRLVKQISEMSIRELTEKASYHATSLAEEGSQRGYHLDRVEACLAEILKNLDGLIDKPWIDG